MIATVTLNRPAKLNALTKAMWRALGDAIRALSRDAALRCVHQLPTEGSRRAGVERAHPVIELRAAPEEHQVRPLQIEAGLREGAALRAVH